MTTYVCTPGELTLFPLVQGAIERVRNAFEATIAKRTQGVNTILISFNRPCSIYPMIETAQPPTSTNSNRP